MSQFNAESRILLKDGVDRNLTLRELALSVGKDRTSVARELKRHRSTTGSEREPSCPLLARPPYVCNPCGRKQRCRFQKWFYLADKAQREYRHVLVSSRTGFNLTEEELERISRIVMEGTARGQSIHHIMVSRATEFTVSEKTVYSLVNAGVIATQRHHLPEAPSRRRRLKPRNSKALEHKVERHCREGRTMDDFRAFMAARPETPVVEIDSVIGRVGGKVLLTVNFDCCGLMLAFLRDRNDAKSVVDIFDSLEERLGGDLFRRLFPVVLTDNGSEFTAPSELERDGGGPRTRVFYCDPYASYEKPFVENNHRNLRRILPKGASFDALTQETLNLVMSHVNSMIREEYGDSTAAARFAALFGKDTLELLGIREIPATEVCLLPSLAGLRQ